MSKVIADELRLKIDEAIERMRKDRHKYCAAHIVKWLTEQARKKEIPDLAKRIEKFSKEVYAMCDDMQIKHEKGTDGVTWVVKVSGSAETTYRKLRLGTDWFEPDEDVITQIMAGLDEQFGI